MSSFKNKVVAITGGSSGLGLSLAQHLASLGAKVSLADVQEGPLKKAVDDIKSSGGEAIGVVTDVRKTADVNAWIDKTIETFGRLDGAANFAGVIGKTIGLSTVADISDEEWDFVIDVNLTGVMKCMRAQLKVMSEGGSIVNASSIAGLTGRPKNASYSASKHAVIGLTRSAAKEFGSKNIRVNAVAPGTIDTPMVANARSTAGDKAGQGNVTKNSDHTALGRLGKPQEMANLAAFLLSDDSSFITGAVYSIDGGWNC